VSVWQGNGGILSPAVAQVLKVVARERN